MIPPLPRPTLFLDRDGVINHEVHRLHDPRDLMMISGAAAAIAVANRAQVPVIVITNQAGIGMGLYGESDLRAVNCAIEARCAEVGAHIDGWYHCPHRPEDDCACRKPRPGMLLSAAIERGADLPRSILIGDKPSDLGAARAAGCRAVLVRTGYGRRSEADLSARGGMESFDGCWDSLAAAVPQVLPLLVGK
jgi:D-glycero-D-manno-heptose 1,7-bisphosphate phosphatase